MPIPRFRRRALLAAIAAVTLPLAAAGIHTRVAAQSNRDFSAAALAKPPATRWPTNGGNLSNQRYSPLTAINRGNAAQLKGVWRARLRGSGTQPQYSGFAAPLVDDGVAYISTGANDVFALSIDTGEILWQWSGAVDPNITSVCCGWNNKGVALSADKVFQGLLDGRLVAIDRANGKTAWSIQAERWQENFSITAAPLYLETAGRSLVIIGFAGGDRGTRGRLKAYDANDGRLIWTFYTIPGPGEPGHETWPRNNDAWKYGGAAIWQTPAYDPELGLLYFSTGNAAPDYNGAFRAGDNLYAAAMVAIDAATGKYRWHFQQVHHDIWDYDAVNPVVLMDVRTGPSTSLRESRVRKAIVEVGKTGWAYILDRETGKPLIGIDEKPVPQEPRQATAKTQPFPRGDAIVPQYIEMAPEGHTLVNDGRIFTPFAGKDPVLAAPGIWGGASWPPSSYDPVQQRLFVCASSVINGYTSSPDTAFFEPVNGNSFLGGGTTFTRVARTGIIAALDVTTNKLAWRYQWPEQCYSGTLATAGGLLFVGRNDGRLTALDSHTGKSLWEFQTGAGMHAPATTFERNGKQYLLAYSAGAALLGSPRGDSVWLFALDGTLGPAQAGTPVPRNAVTISEGRAPGAPVQTPAQLRAAADVENGRRLFAQACAVCHGPDGKSGHGAAPSLAVLTNFDAVMQTVTAGRNTMPAFRGTFTPDQIRDVSAFVVGPLAAAR